MLDDKEGNLFLGQSDGPKQYAAEDDEEDVLLYGMHHEGELSIWLVLKGTITDGASVQLMGELMHFIKQETSIQVHHLCIAAANAEEKEHAAHLHERVRQKVKRLLHTLDAMKK